MNKRILMVVTNGQSMSNGHLAGIWLSEFTEPYEELTSKGYEITIVSPNGGESQIDPNSLAGEGIPSKWQNLADLLKETSPIDSVKASDFAGIFLPGGHGAMFDLPNNEHLHKLLRDFAESDKSIGAVCHGPAGLVGAKLSNGEPLVAGKTITAFTDAEEYEVKLEKEMPFLLESKLRELGATLVVRSNWEDHVETDGKLITGQNPQSSISVAKEFLKTLD
ncbi:type 1 glutamine amidotransferase domain-containing protein [Paenibacillus pini]